MMNVEVAAKTDVQPIKEAKDLITWIIFLLDRSGSMDAIKYDMIGGFNQFLKDQKKNPGKCKTTLYQFDTVFDTVFDNIDLNDSVELTDKVYIPRGGTALIDSMVKTINLTNEKLASLDEKDKPDKILVVTITDGEENSSKEYTSEQLKKMVYHQTEKWKWEFAYIGANQDSWSVGSSMGYMSGKTCNYVATNAGVKGMFRGLTESTTKYRSCESEAFTFDKDTADEIK